MQNSTIRGYLAAFTGLIGLLVVGFALTLTVSAAPLDTRLRVIHASPSTGEVDVYVEGTAVLTDVAYANVSPYLNLEAGTYLVQVTVAGAGLVPPSNAVISETVTLEADSAYTVAAVDQEDTIALAALDTTPVVFDDNLTPPAEDEALVTVYHLSPDAGEVDVAVDGGPTLISSLAFTQTETITVAADTYDLLVTPTVTTTLGIAVDELPLSLPNITLEGGQVYSAFAIGTNNTDETPTDLPFEVLLQPELAQLRVVHASTAAGNVDVYLNGTATLTDVNYFTVSPYLDVPAGDYLVQVVAAGESDLSTAVISQTATITAGMAFTAAATDLQATSPISLAADVSNELALFVDDLSDPGEGEARVQVYHLASDVPTVDVRQVGMTDTLVSDISFRERDVADEGDNDGTIPSGIYDLEVVVPSLGNASVPAGMHTFRSNTIYSAFAIGTLATETPEDFPVEVRILPPTKLTYLPFIIKDQ
jgi:hypothetical protein